MTSVNMGGWILGGDDKKYGFKPLAKGRTFSAAHVDYANLYADADVPVGCKAYPATEAAYWRKDGHLVLVKGTLIHSSEVAT